MPKRKKMLPAGDKADDLSRLPLAADLVSLPNISSGREWLAAIRAADPQIRPESAAYSADKALKCLAVGDIDAALSHAMLAAWRVRMHRPVGPLADAICFDAVSVPRNRPKGRPGRQQGPTGRGIQSAAGQRDRAAGRASQYKLPAQLDSKNQEGREGSRKLASGLSASTCPPI